MRPQVDRVWAALWQALLMAMLAIACIFTNGVSGQETGALVVKHATGEDRNLAWRVEPRWRLPGTGESGVLLSYVIASDIATDTSGNVAVLDRLGRKVYIVDLDGVVRDSLGREGQGPGELSRPINVTFDGEGAIAVLDRGKAAFVRWSHGDGAVLDQIPGPATFVGTGVDIVGDGYVYKSLDMEGGNSVRYQLLHATHDNETVLARGPFMRVREANLRSCGASVMGAPIFAPDLPWTTRHTRVVVAPDDRYILDVFEAGRRIMRITRDIGPVAVTRSMVLRHVQGRRIGHCIIPAAESVSGFGHAETMPAIAAIRVAPSGDIWVRRGTIQGDVERIDIFRRDGNYVGTTTGIPFPAAFIDEDLVIAISADALDVPIITAYRVVRD